MSKYKAIVLEVPITTVTLGEATVEVPEVEFHNYGYNEISLRVDSKVLVQVHIDGDSDKQSAAQSVIDGYGITVPEVAGN